MIIGTFARGAVPNENWENPNLGVRIRTLREELGLMQTELAKQSYLAPESITLIEQGAFYPSINKLLLIARALHVHPRELFS